MLTGMMEAFNNLDAQVTYRIPSAKATIKLGETNVLNNRHLEYAGGPTIGALYYVAITINGF